MGGFSVDIGCNTISLSLQPQVKHWKAPFLIFFLYGELDTGVLLVDMLEQFILMNLFDDHPCVIDIPTPEFRGVGGFCQCLILNFFHEEVG